MTSVQAQGSSCWKERNNPHKLSYVLHTYTQCMHVGTPYTCTTILKGNDIRSWHDGWTGKSTCHTSLMFGSPESMFKEIQKWWCTSVISRLQWAGNQHRRTHSSTTPPLQSQLLWSKQHCSKQWEIDSEGRRLGVTPGIALWPAQVYSCNMLASSPRSFYTHATHIHTPYTQSKIIF